jgi:hypothetical protein
MSSDMMMARGAGSVSSFVYAQFLHLCTILQFQVSQNVDETFE